MSILKSREVSTGFKPGKKQGEVALVNTNLGSRVLPESMPLTCRTYPLRGDEFELVRPLVWVSPGRDSAGRPRTLGR